MSKFKVGDRVRLTGEMWDGKYGFPKAGEVHEIDEIDDAGDPWFEGRRWYVDDNPQGYAAELVEEAPDIETFVKGIADTMRVHFNPITPSYYRFPNGVWVKDISKYLTSAGGQAVQYVARSTRIDGNNKGDRIENLRKAIELINWEIERIEEEQA